MAKEIKLTQESLDAYKDELEYLKTTRADEVAEQLKEARSFGDLSENAEYDEAKNEQGKLYSRIAELEEIIKHAVVVTGDSYAAERFLPAAALLLRISRRTRKRVPLRRLSGGRSDGRQDL